MTETKVRNKWCTVRMNEEEYEALMKKFQGTISPRLSDYVRHVLLEKPVTVVQRNTSMDDFIHELSLLRLELSAIGNNFNQVVKKLNGAPYSKEYLIWLRVCEGLQKQLLVKISGIQSEINKFSKEWYLK